MQIERPFHRGELEVQERLGERFDAEHNARGIQDAIVRGAFRFVEERSFALVGSVDPGGATWSSLVVGEAGFARVPDARRLELDLERVALHPADPLFENLAHDPRVGTLFVDPGTRRRLRINGRARRAEQRLVVDVEESFPNCPRFLQKRTLKSAVDLSERVATESHERGETLHADDLALVTDADTFFVASANPAGGVDVSHRGGPPGFVQALDATTLAVPDYPGNHLYQTLGNFVTNPSAGLTFLDFRTGRTLLLTGTASIVWERAGQETSTGGTNRFWTFRVSGWRAFRLPVRFAWSAPEPSPYDPAGPDGRACPFVL